jgi:hypothetical protein
MNQATETAVGAAEAKKKKTVAVLYNGATKAFAYHPHHKVEALLKSAIHEFGIAANQHLLSLFNAAGAELPEASTLEGAGVKAGDELVLRPSTVKGG